ncbi:Uncharacterized protein YdaL [Halobacillus alkaliphilus]|uniref:Uncharacterized protein YdaL n=1 Tax=Halobacillus alkaliphilus TaxID=396056 RepID=A0A1I2R2U8_9BACI|nr:polysaccharide deacetylase family protein [Halobacillus alkaliphilus]SFG32907.1 Uncharacterized protein YdaL [Halobacillus alkaliphilus]
MNKHYPVVILMTALIVVVFILTTHPVMAAKSSDPNVLIVYPSEQKEINEQQRILDMLISHFTTDIDFKQPDEIAENDLKTYSHVFYQGTEKEDLPKGFQKALNDYEGTLVAQGHNLNQLGDRLSFAAPMKEEAYTKLNMKDEPEKKVKTSIHTVFNVKLDEEAEVIVEAQSGERILPIVSHFEKAYYVGTPIIDSPFSTFLGETLHEVFQSNHVSAHEGYIRLEDVHPLVDPDNLRGIAEVLKEKEIPYMIAVIPVYINPENGERVHLSDYPKVLEALKYMQANGGSVVLHGYTHQYRDSETGEGFEFWDVKNNTPVYKDADDDTPLKKRGDFKNQKEYESYRKGLIEFEQSYVSGKLTSGINELTSFGLHPLAFEAPHYTMSQNGYQTASKHFSTYVGQLQLSDDNWQVMASAPYITKPSFLHGMKLLPETLGYVEPDAPDAVDAIMDRAEEQMIVRDGMLSLFYHPYLGVERFKELLSRLETLPDVQWIDLKEGEHSVTSDKVDIQAAAGRVEVDGSQFSLVTNSKTSLNYFIHQTIEKISWGLVGTGSLGVLFFFSSTIISRRRFSKIERRDHVG